MQSLDGPLILIVAGWVTYVIALAASRLLARSRFLPDKPNHRSSHEQVTSRGGGFAILGGWIAGMIILAAFSGSMEVALASLSFGGVASLALFVGYADDKWAPASFWKFAGQIAVAAVFAAVFAPIKTAPIPFVGEVDLGGFAFAATVFWIVGFMNAFNFMDGANGVAAGTASVGLSVFAMIVAFLGSSFAAAAAILLAVACFGFLPVNLARGKLFMGDNGSQTISFVIAAFGVFAANATGARASVLIMPTIFLPFIFDVTWTLAHRIVRRKNILAAHREHLYQLLLRLGASHMRVAVIYMALTAFSSAAAILMLALRPSLQWLAPAFMCAVFAVMAARLHMAAFKEGLFDDVGEEEAAPLQMGSLGDVPNAAE